MMMITSEEATCLAWVIMDYIQNHCQNKLNWSNLYVVRCKRHMYSSDKWVSIPFLWYFLQWSGTSLVFWLLHALLRLINIFVFSLYGFKEASAQLPLLPNSSKELRLNYHFHPTALANSYLFKTAFKFDPNFSYSKSQ